MTIGASLFCIAVGAILMVIGGLGLVLTLGFFFLSSRSERPSGPSRPLR